ncbi:MAG: A/G-specific adenine glycosylase [Eubacteriales bacterium]
MNYERMQQGRFIERPNRFIAHIEIEGEEQVVHVKNTGRCKELLTPSATVYVQKAANPERKTQWDLIAVEKGERVINMDSQVTNHVVKEWIEKGNLFQDVTLVKPEVTYGDSRFDLYVEAQDKKIFIEVKGVTLENDNIVQFPDAPSERAVKHVKELVKAKKEGYEAYVFFVIQMKDVRYFTPNVVTHKAFADALVEAREAGVEVLAYACDVTWNSIAIANQVDVILEYPTLYEMREPLVEWYLEHKRELPWRKNKFAYEIWVSEIMLQQTRVEAVKPFYKRFLDELPTVQHLAEVEEEKLLKLWEGLGYYNRVRNMQLAAQQIMVDYQGEFPEGFEEILKLKGIGSYTAGAISSIAFGVPKPAVDGNVLRVISRFLGDDGDIMKASVRKRMEAYIEKIIPENYPGEFNQGLIELGAIVCVPNGEAKCDCCPLARWCEAKKQGRIQELPVKTKQKARKIEKRTVLIFKDGENIAIRKRPSKGLLAGLYELPNVLEHWSLEDVISYSKSIGLMPIKVEACGEAKHIFSHIEWQMIGYEIKVDELEKSCTEDFIFIEPQEIEKRFPIPAAFAGYTEFLDIKLGQSAYQEG